MVADRDRHDLSVHSCGRLEGGDLFHRGSDCRAPATLKGVVAESGFVIRWSHRHGFLELAWCLRRQDLVHGKSLQYLEDAVSDCLSAHASTFAAATYSCSCSEIHHCDSSFFHGAHRLLEHGVVLPQESRVALAEEIWMSGLRCWRQTPRIQSADALRLSRRVHHLVSRVPASLPSRLPSWRAPHQQHPL